MSEELTTYQIYLMLLGFLEFRKEDHTTGIMLKAMLTELYKRATESEDNNE